jgi:hypothetical protein
MGQKELAIGITVDQQLNGNQCHPFEAAAQLSSK